MCYCSRNIPRIGTPIIGLTGNKCLLSGKRRKLKGRLRPAFFIWNDLVGDPLLCFGVGIFLSCARTDSDLLNLPYQRDL